jgi:hypothetical protein
MTSKTIATFGRLLWLVFALISLSIGHLFGDAIQPGDKVVPRDSYELRFLGCKLNEVSDNKKHIGIFVFIWKGKDPIRIKSIPSSDKKTFRPSPDFRAHEGSEWISVGGIEDPPEWVAIQPGQVITFSTTMGWIDNNINPTLFGINKADKACLILLSKDGELFSDEFPLPLVPVLKK